MEIDVFSKERSKLPKRKILPTFNYERETMSTGKTNPALELKNRLFLLALTAH